MKQFWLLVVVLLAGCVRYVPDYSDQDSGYRLILHQAVAIPAERTRVFIQNGQIAGAGFDSYQVSCNLEVRELLDQVQSIEPGTFVVNRIQQFFEEVASWNPLKLASVGRSGAELDGGPSMIFRGWHLWLHSPSQPHVMRLSCRGVFAEPWEAELPTFEEVRMALGGIATLKKVNEPIKPGRF